MPEACAVDCDAGVPGVTSEAGADADDGGED
jgi:hypothetical protein